MEKTTTKIYTDKVLAISSLTFVFLMVAGLALYPTTSIQFAAQLMEWVTQVFTTPVL